MINVTKTFLPPFEEYTKMVKRAWDKGWITNNGELSIELEKKLKSYFEVSNFLFCGNGTIALQMALKALEITGEVITTPFSYVATTNAILWENCRPIFVDINNENFCIDASKIEKAITPKTQAILATHVYGCPCDVNAIETIARTNNIKIIYDAAHAFGTKIYGKSVLEYGDVSTCSFHATKLFHTVEGGCITTKDDALARKLYLLKQFGHLGDEYFCIGINGKNSEMHAAMGLCNFKYIDEILEKRKSQWLLYKELLKSSNLQILNIGKEIHFNYAYFPLIFNSQKDLVKAMEELKFKNIIPRRYFYPALNTLPYLNYQPCPIAEDIAKRIICLPLFHDLTDEQQLTIINIILEKQS
ncbi:MAG TPA: DegT/DnrJ/EryC1/StrS family aminotransferase [Puia sp.]|nr:DegT/DnrJ/EryC1/StrS family aminotransferase [Puia sp.]